MEQSSQRDVQLHTQEELAEGLPEGYPPKREHLHDVAPLANDLQSRLDKIRKQNLGEGPRAEDAPE
jgi:hypothetical protein